MSATTEPTRCGCGQRRHVWVAGMHPVCIECDRVRCGRCRKPIPNGHAKKCGCGNYVGLDKPPRGAG